MAMRIEIDDLSRPEVVRLLQSHLQSLAAITPPESMHALDLAALRQPEVTFWSVWDGQELVGCGALKELDLRNGEIKSMRTATTHLRKGVGSTVLEHILAEAARRGYCRLSLETGASEEFEPARRLYAKFGFRLCGPFGSYRDDPNSVYVTREL